jgi:hypothetical protein
VNLEAGFECPFCHTKRDSKCQMDFHIKYGHADVYPLMSEDIEKVDLEEKLNRLIVQKKMLEKDIDCIKTIMQMKENDIE